VSRRRTASAEAGDVFSIEISARPASSGPPVTMHAWPSKAIRTGELSVWVSVVVVVVGGGCVAVVVVEEADTEVLVDPSSSAVSLEQLARPIHATTTHTRRRR